MTAPRFLALNRWADRAPARRYPLLLLTLLLLWGLAGGVAGCGGGDWPDTADAPTERVQPCAQPLDLVGPPAPCGWSGRT